ncbi:zinc finger matrin-type protein 4 isoform X1 [Chroicocephalus ridibundus]|uniref:zinc finger matrin-type protein 4 isoform X1 n=1 Tax=Chroicocephalus ridibundus TaxID=1192867 RepID=UPI002FDED869
MRRDLCILAERGGANRCCQGWSWSDGPDPPGAFPAQSGRAAGGAGAGSGARRPPPSRAASPERSSAAAPAASAPPAAPRYPPAGPRPAGSDDEILRHRPGIIHGKLLQSVQRPAHIGVPARGPLRESEACQQSSPLLYASSHRWRLSSEKAPVRKQTTLSSLKQPHADSPPVVPSPHQWRDSDRYCQLCAAWFNNPMMAQQHYDGKKHKKNAARADLLEQLGKTLDLGELRGLKRSYTCNTCSVTLNSIEQYHAHLKGSKHQTNLKNQ